MSELSELTLLIMRIGFLLLIWLFIFAIVYALRSDLFGGPVRRMPGEASRAGGAAESPAQPVAAQTSAQAAAAQAAAPTGPIGHAAQTGQTAGLDPSFLTPAGPAPITPSGGALPSAGGYSLDTKHDPARVLVITSGKAAGTSIPLDTDIITIGRSADSTLVIVDEYTSTYHARLARSGERWTLTDLDSTNGTKLDGTRITDQMPLPTFTPVTIGTTTFELRP